jgi:hypothetical protein
VLVNLEAIPADRRDCYLAAAVFANPSPPARATGNAASVRRLVLHRLRSTRAILIHDELSLFRGDTERRYRDLGPPTSPPKPWWRTSPSTACRE